MQDRSLGETAGMDEGVRDSYERLDELLTA
jgi:hypothetical protein